MGMRILIDTNVLLDYLLSREPFFAASRKIVEACAKEEVSGCIAAHSISNMFYIMRKAFGIQERRELLAGLCDLFDVEGIDKAKIIDALQNEEFADFEDCLQSECATAYRADYIVTRNCDDFKGSRVPTIEPEQFCVLLQE